VITGDGADQVFAGAHAAIYLPIVSALAESSGVELCCPYLDGAVVALAAGAPPNPHKTALRDLARGKLPDTLVDAPKIARLAPAIDLTTFEDRPRFERLAARLDRPLRLDDDRRRTGWTTLSRLRGARDQRLTPVRCRGDPPHDLDAKRAAVAGPVAAVA
jgi:hypothetical protein